MKNVTRRDCADQGYFILSVDTPWFAFRSPHSPNEWSYSRGGVGKYYQKCQASRHGVYKVSDSRPAVLPRWLLPDGIS